MGLGIPPLIIKIVLESNPLKSTMLVGRLAVMWTFPVLIAETSRSVQGVCREPINKCICIIIIIIIVIVILIVTVITTTTTTTTTNNNSTRRCARKSLRACGGGVACECALLRQIVRPFFILIIVRPRIFESKLRNHCAKKLVGALGKPTSFMSEFV